MKLLKLAPACLLFLAVIVSCDGCGGDDPVRPTDPPRITQFSALPVDIMPGDSTLLSYQVTGAESLVLKPGDISLSPTSSGQVYVSPVIPTEYGLVATNEGGRDSASLVVTMAGAVASFDSFQITPDRILIGDSLTVSWQTSRADSIVVRADMTRILSSLSGTGQTKLAPSSSTRYEAVAYNAIGNDTVSVYRTVEVPAAVRSVNGPLYKGTMGSGIDLPELVFQVVDAAEASLRLPWLYFEIVEGDGQLQADSALPDELGNIANDYIFDGQLGHAVLHAFVPDLDTVEVMARASVLRLGSGGQGQYIKFDDTYADVFLLNGTPELAEPDPFVWRNYAVYENQLGLVVAITDVNQNEQIEPDEPIDKIIVNTVYSDTTLEGLGVGSSIHDFRAVYDPIYDSADSHFYDATPPATEAFVYDDLGAIFWALAGAGADSTVVEIHLWEPTAKSAVRERKLKGEISNAASSMRPVRINKSR